MRDERTRLNGRGMIAGAGTGTPAATRLSPSTVRSPNWTASVVIILLTAHEVGDCRAISQQSPTAHGDSQAPEVSRVPADIPVGLVVMVTLRDSLPRLATPSKSSRQIW